MKKYIFFDYLGGGTEIFMIQKKRFAKLITGKTK